MAKWWRELQQEMQPVLKNLRVGVYGSGGAPFHHAGLVALWGGEPIIIDADAIQRGALEVVDVLVVPGGGMRAMEGLLAPLGIEGAAHVRRWVAEGGMYIGSCAGSFLPACVGQGYWDAHPGARELYMMPACLANSGESELEGLVSPGVGTVEVTVAASDHWLAEGLPARFELVHYNGPMFVLQADQAAFHDEVVPASPEGVVRFARATSDFTPSEQFLAAESPATNVFETCLTREAYTAITTRYGSGIVVLFGSHPEFGFDVLQLGWGEGVRLFANALKQQASKRQQGRILETDTAASTTSIPSPAATLRHAADQLTDIARRYDALARTTPTAWLEPGHTPSFLGRSAEQLWTEGLKRAAEVSHATARYLRALIDAHDENDLRRAGLWIDREGKAGQDFGFVGLRQLVAQIDQAVSVGERKLSEPPFAMQHAYDGFLDHPFHLLVGSYLSAAGLTAGAALSSTVIGSLVGYTGEAPVGPHAERVAA